MFPNIGKSETSYEIFFYFFVNWNNACIFPDIKKGLLKFAIFEYDRECFYYAFIV